jgi:mRNA-degrading endonuclease toxin of MazEF toxin-antitoxin module
VAVGRSVARQDLGDRIRSVDKARLRGRLGRLTPRDLAKAELALEITLGLPP